MSSFVYNSDTVTLPTSKTNLRPLRTGRAPGNAFQAADYNALKSALADVQSALLGGVLHGFTALAAQPANPTNYTSPLGGPYLWAKNDGHLHYFDGTTDHDLSASAGGGYSTVYNGASSLTQRSNLKFDGTTLVASDDGTSKTLVNFSGVFNVSGVGTGQTAGYVCANPDAATVGNPKYSPLNYQTGHGWSTGSSASHAIDFGWQVAPVSGNDTDASYNLLCRLNGGSWTNIVQVATDGSITADNAIYALVSGVGTAKTDGLVTLNSTAAANNAQQYSPLSRWTGQGWATNSGGSSMQVDFAAHCRPIQGTAAPTGEFWFANQVNGGGWTDLFGIISTGGVKVPYNGIGTSNVTGLNLSNSTAAGAGAQQVSPMLVFTGQGWKTNATAASQTVQFAGQLTPVQGTAAPTGIYSWSFSINGGGWSAAATLDSSGNFATEASGSFTGLTTTVASGDAFTINYAQASAGAYTLVRFQRNGTSKGTLALDASDYLNLKGSAGVNIVSPSGSGELVADDSVGIKALYGTNYFQVTSSTLLMDYAATNFVQVDSTGVTLTASATVATAKSTAGLSVVSHRFQEAKGANVAIAQPLTLGTDGNLFIITGSGTTINGIVTTNWQAGSMITLEFSSTTSNTVTHNSGTPGSNAVAIKLNGSTNFTTGTSGFSTLSLVYDGTFWVECGRSVG